MYSKEYLRQQVLASFESKEVEGDLAQLVANVLAEYAYLHQLIDINILMENSFQRSKLLNSRIQQASDRFYSVDRGHNRLVKINNLSCYKSANTIYPMGLVTQNAGGKYKLYAASDWVFEPSQNLTVTGYLALDCKTVALKGTNKLYMDIEENQNGIKIPYNNISEDLVVYQTWTDQNLAQDYDFFTSENGETAYYKKVNLVSSLTELFEKQSSDPTNEYFCAITMPNYGVRLYSSIVIPNTNDYVAKFLVCPDATVEEKEPASSIKNISNCKITNDTSFEILRATQYRLEDLDAIYLYASNNLKQAGVLKSLNSLEEIIPECFPQFQSWKMLVGPMGGIWSGDNNLSNDNVVLHDVVNVSDSYAVSSETLDASPTLIDYVPNGTINIWYVLKNDINLPMEDDNYLPSNPVVLDKTKWNEKIKAYYIPANTDIYFRNINTKLEANDTPPTHVCVLKDYKIKIYYSSNIDYQRVRNIIESFQYNIGEDFNPYKIISALVIDSLLYQKIQYVEILHKENGAFVPAKVVKIALDQRWWFQEDYSELVEFQQV